MYCNAFNIACECIETRQTTTTRPFIPRFHRVLSTFLSLFSVFFCPYVAHLLMIFLSSLCPVSHSARLSLFIYFYFYAYIYISFLFRWIYISVLILYGAPFAFEINGSRCASRIMWMWMLSRIHIFFLHLYFNCNGLSVWRLAYKTILCVRTAEDIPKRFSVFTHAPCWI